MRIQHNITAMNAYRNYNNNTSAIGKNLEKLSSGYKINRAGDDAAGLAVSQKMRLQIAGLAQAQKNAKSGISYIQTAEGALQEVHEMLERMYTLAEQSANGTFDDDTDRVQLQKEVNNLMEEIDRIGKTANFNGMGIFAEYAGSTGSSKAAKYYEAKDVKVAGADITGVDAPETTTPAQKAQYTISVAGFQAGDTLTIDGTTISFDTDVDTSFGAGKLPANATAGGKYKLTYATNTLTIEAVNAGVDDISKSFTGTIGGANKTADDLTTAQEGAAETKTPAHKTYDLSGTWQAGDAITVNGKTYTFDAAGDGTGGKFQDLTTLKKALDADGVTMDDTTNTAVTFTKKANGGNGGGGKSIKFWVGAEFSNDNILELQAMNLSSTSMQIGKSEVTADAGVDPEEVEAGDLTGVDITNADSAMDSLDIIKKASNAVSDMRGTLGAMQNRLDHTIKNLSVMQENMQDAESVIRDTDVAEEMMAYTKNSILVQSAQAMLAQANQLPQGVLQLLQ